MHEWVTTTYQGLADRLERDGGWDAPSLCEGWRARHVVAHVTMPVRFTPERYGAEMAAVGGDFGRMSDSVAERDCALPEAELLGQLRAPELHAWEPPGGGALGALSHAVIHSLDVTLAAGVPPVAPVAAVLAVLDPLVAAGGSTFGRSLDGVRLVATDVAWSAGEGREVTADSGTLLALVAGRTTPAGETLRQR